MMKVWKEHNRHCNSKWVVAVCPYSSIFNSIVILRTREQIAMQLLLEHLTLIIPPDKKNEAFYLSQTLYLIITKFTDFYYML